MSNAPCLSLLAKFTLSAARAGMLTVTVGSVFGSGGASLILSVVPSPATLA